eukprot:354468-Chlamydomonas_euryale.AAC.1
MACRARTSSCAAVRPSHATSAACAARSSTRAPPEWTCAQSHRLHSTWRGSFRTTTCPPCTGTMRAGTGTTTTTWSNSRSCGTAQSSTTRARRSRRERGLNPGAA